MRAPPATLAGLKVTRVRDYLALTETVPGQPPQPFAGPQGDMVILDLDVQGNYVAVRPSGTEPKIKFYMFTYEPPEQIANLDDTKQAMAARLADMQRSWRVRKDKGVPRMADCINPTRRNS